MSGVFIEGALAFAQYTDATYNYFGEASPASALTDPNWRVNRMNIATNRIEWVDGGQFTQVFTDLGTVAALTFA